MEWGSERHVEWKRMKCAGRSVKYLYAGLDGDRGAQDP